MTSPADPAAARRRRRLVVETAAATTAEVAEPSPQDADQPEAPPSQPLGPGPKRASGPWARLFVWLLGLVLSIALWMWAAALYRDAVAASPVLGWIVLGLLIAVGLAGLVMIVRELAAIGRLRRVGALRARAESALLPGGEPREADALLRSLRALYRGRRDLAWADAGVWRDVDRRAREHIDAAEKLAVFERAVVSKLDASAQAEIQRAARRVAAATAIMPSALLDAIAALVINLMMIRRVAEIYGGRAGAFGSLRLARRVVAHAMAAGLIEMGSDLLTPLLGGGLAAGASRRLGEGLVNGALTARIGLAAAELCRPMPYHVVKRPNLREVSWGALRGIAER